MHNSGCCIVCERDIPKINVKFIELHDNDVNSTLDVNADVNIYNKLISVSSLILVVLFTSKILRADNSFPFTLLLY